VTARVRDASAIQPPACVGVRAVRMASSWLERRTVFEEGDDGVVVSAASSDQKNSVASEIAAEAWMDGWMDG
jgi:predicted GNAT family acetyltransferase